MTDRSAAVQVGAPDPDRRTSPIFEDTDEELEVEGQQFVRDPICYFNDKHFSDGQYVCSGHEMMQCRRGNWIRVGSCDRDNP